MSKELLPCPFGCDEEPYIEENTDYYGHPVYDLEHKCPNGTKIIIRHHVRETVIKAWNTRQPIREKYKPVKLNQSDWIDQVVEYQCTVCNAYITGTDQKYCPNCGEIDWPDNKGE